jgi:hypothetical protein
MMQDDPESLLKLLTQHLTWYPLMELRDIYKLLYQGVLGSEHLLNSPEEYTRYLRHEYEHLQPHQHQRLLEPVRSDGVMFRLNLRPYKSKQKNIDQLATYLFETAQLIFGTKAALSEVWAVFTRLCQQGQIGHFDPDLISQFSQWLEEKEYPCVHHSKIYRREYQPAYRLISDKFISLLDVADASQI